MNDDLSAEQIVAITTFVDIEAPPSGPTAHIIFGTNQARPAIIAADRYHQGLAPLIIATGGVNRHNGIIEGREFHRLLVERGVPETTIRLEDQSTNTWHNVEMALPFLREAVTSGLPITAVAKWYHRRAIHTLRTLLPDVDALHAITWEPVYGGTPVTRTNWPYNPYGKRRVIREWQEIPRRVADGTLKEANLIDKAWR
jgi:uncharacterized SAM-binding protein YcdF (DUF218 family)